MYLEGFQVILNRFPPIIVLDHSESIESIAYIFFFPTGPGRAGGGGHRVTDITATNRFFFTPSLS